MTIFKYPLKQPGHPAILKLPEGSVPLYAGQQMGDFFLWVMTPSENRETIDRLFMIYGTGHHIPEGSKWINTFLDGPWVWHAFEI